MIYLLNKETGLVQQLDEVAAAHDLSLFVMFINHFLAPRPIWNTEI